MSEKRKDGKGRILLAGERQRNDGRYEYRYTDGAGRTHSVYSWKLVSTDKLPPGKKCEEPLRDMERRIRRDLEDNINTSARYTVDQYYDEVVLPISKARDTTKHTRKLMYDRHVRDGLGARLLTSVTYSEIKKYYFSLIERSNLTPGTVGVINTMLHAIFATAKKDGIIRTDPTDKVLSEIKKSVDWEPRKKRALTIPQQKAFMKACTEDLRYTHWVPLFIVLLGTGMRIGEAIGLRWQDCDFDKRIISIDHALYYTGDESGRYARHLGPPKTKTGVRIIPMLSEVEAALRREYDRQRTEGFNTSIIDGYSGFVFQNTGNHCLFGNDVNRLINKIVEGYNSRETERAEKEGRDPELLPHISLHILRHTFCTRFCENESNIKVIQEIMGHSNITTTMEIYNDATYEKKEESFSKLDGKIILS